MVEIDVQVYIGHAFLVFFLIVESTSYSVFLCQHTCEYAVSVVYGGGEESNVEGNTQVNITGGTITENVFGGGKGEADEFSCSKAMIGVNNTGAGADLTTDENKNKLKDK